MDRILLIAVDDALREGLGHSTSLAGCVFEKAAGSADALRRLRRRSFGVAITSAATSVEEDLALVEEMRLLRPSLRTIVLAPRTTAEDVIAALRAQVFACFGAPFDIEEVAGMARLALERTDWKNGIELRSSHRDWISLRVDCQLLTAERLVAFLGELPTDIPGEEREGLMLAFREIVLNAMEHGAGFDPEKTLDISAVRTARAIVYYVRDPGPGFRLDAIPHAAVSNPPDNPIAHSLERIEQGLRPGGFGILLARKIVDELIYNEAGNEVLLIKHTR
jgi:anti-sigma regulatory factor (Ser/Thr protein kinase)/ActR/RegA family two-component response regulator